MNNSPGDQKRRHMRLNANCILFKIIEALKHADPETRRILQDMLAKETANATS